MSREVKFETLEGLAKELEQAKEAVELLELVWQDCGPYNQQRLSEATLIKLQRFFRFDDGE